MLLNSILFYNERNSKKKENGKFRNVFLNSF